VKISLAKVRERKESRMMRGRGVGRCRRRGLTPRPQNTTLHDEEGVEGGPNISWRPRVGNPPSGGEVGEALREQRRRWRRSEVEGLPAAARVPLNGLFVRRMKPSSDHQAGKSKSGRGRGS
jgi:hypothetical protein